MAVTKLELVWISVKNFDEAIRYYTEVLGMELLERTDEWKWAELRGKEGGALLGIAEHGSESPIKPGNNAVISLTVDDMEETKRDLGAKGVQFEGETCEVPGHVKLQICRDLDGNLIHLAEMLGEK